jgi:ABC-type amino acid transport substrate-binding protein
MMRCNQLFVHCLDVNEKKTRYIDVHPPLRTSRMITAGHKAKRRQHKAMLGAGWLFACSVLLPVVAAPAAVPACQLRFALDTPFPPHIVLTEQQPEGINVRMLEALAAKVGCTVRFVQSPWARAIKLLQQGEIDVISQLSYTRQRAQDIAFIGPHLEERIWLIADPTKVPPLRQLGDLPRWPITVSIAVLNGGYFGEEFQQFRDSPAMQRRFYPMVSNQDKLALLESGRVQAVLEEELVWQWRMQQTPTAFQPMLLVHSDPVYFGFSRASVSPELLSQLAAAWQQLYRSGELQQIRRSYLNPLKDGPAALASQSDPATLSDMPLPHPHL